MHPKDKETRGYGSKTCREAFLTHPRRRVILKALFWVLMQFYKYKYLTCSHNSYLLVLD